MSRGGAYWRSLLTSERRHVLRRYPRAFTERLRWSHPWGLLRTIEVQSGVWERVHGPLSLTGQASRLTYVVEKAHPEGWNYAPQEFLRSVSAQRARVIITSRDPGSAVRSFVRMQEQSMGSWRPSDSAEELISAEADFIMAVRQSLGESVLLINFEDGLSESIHRIGEFLVGGLSPAQVNEIDARVSAERWQRLPHAS